MPILTLTADGIDDETLQQLTRNLRRDIQAEGMQASLATKAAEPGAMGDMETIGQIILTAVGAGGFITVLAQGIKTYLSRERRLKINLTLAKGNKAELDLTNYRAKEVDEIAEALQAFFQNGNE